MEQYAEQNQNQEMICLAGNRVQSADLLRQEKELVILHNSEEYKLRLTGNGKLILTK